MLWNLASSVIGMFEGCGIQSDGLLGSRVGATICPALAQQIANLSGIIAELSKVDNYLGNTWTGPVASIMQIVFTARCTRLNRFPAAAPCILCL